MKSKYYITIGIVVFISVIIAFSGCVQNQQEKTQNTTNPQNTSQNTVMIQNFTYIPHTITIKSGTNVTWINKDSAIHDISSDSGVFASKDLAKEERYTHNFTKPGEYPYHCNEHPSMTGTIIVQ